MGFWSWFFIVVGAFFLFCTVFSIYQIKTAPLWDADDPNF